MRCNQLSPKERRKLDRCLSNIEVLSNRPMLSDVNAFILKQQVRVVLKLLGALHLNKVLVAQALYILRDPEDHKVERLEQLANGR